MSILSIIILNLTLSLMIHKKAPAKLRTLGSNYLCTLTSGYIFLKTLQDYILLFRLIRHNKRLVGRSSNVRLMSSCQKHGSMAAVFLWCINWVIYLHCLHGLFVYIDWLQLFTAFWRHINHLWIFQHFEICEYFDNFSFEQIDLQN